MDQGTCIECGDTLPVERVDLGYRYCTKARCQAVHHRGLLVTTVGVNKSADTVVTAGDDRSHSGAGTDVAPVPDRPRAAPRTPPRRTPPSSTPPRRGRWTAQQEKVVRLYHDMGLSPRQIAERAAQHTPRLAITERLAVQILSAGPRR